MFWNISADKENWVKKRVAEMTLNEKIGQMVCELNTKYMEIEDKKTWLRQYPIGSMFVGSEIIKPGEEDSAITKQLVSETKDVCKIPLAFCGDFEHGIGCQIAGYTRLPDLMALGATHDPKLAYEYGRIIAEEGKSLGLHWGFGPVADLNINHCNHVANTRCVGDNPDYAVKMLSALIRGMQDHGMCACPKHFPGDGTDARNQHIVTSLNLLSKNKWDKQHGKVFKALIDAGAASIMIGHIGFPDYEPIDSVKGKFRPATASKRIMTDLLRGDLGFKGIILTDALCMNGFISWGTYEERILDSFNGGTDVFLWPETVRFFELMKAALKDGRASMERLEESVHRIMSFKAWLGLDKEDKKKYELTATARNINGEISAKVAEKSLTLLRNRIGDIPLNLPPKADVLMLYTPENESIPKKPLEYFATEFESNGVKTKVIPFSQLGKEEDIEKYTSVFLVCLCRPMYVDYSIFNNYAIWGFMNNEKIRKRIFISFGTPYLLYEVAEADTYLNVYSDSEISQRIAAKALLGKIPFRGRSPVTMPNCFDFGDGIQSE
jgi:beta-N-acetylhexosaminidase